MRGLVGSRAGRERPGAYALLHTGGGSIATTTADSELRARYQLRDKGSLRAPGLWHAGHSPNALPSSARSGNAPAAAADCMGGAAAGAPKNCRSDGTISRRGGESAPLSTAPRLRLMATP